jgi:hypothetical protein
MIERVKLVDAVLDEPACTWLGPAVDKRRHFVRHRERRLELEASGSGSSRSILPARRSPDVADHVLESISGQLSRPMLERYSHIRIDAKRSTPLTPLVARRTTAAAWISRFRNPVVSAGNPAASGWRRTGWPDRARGRHL